MEEAISLGLEELGVSLADVKIDIVEEGTKGFLGILGWIVTVIIISAPLSCGLGLGFSVALRKKGKSKQSFWVQFAGIAGLGVTLLFFLLFADNLFASLN